MQMVDVTQFLQNQLKGPGEIKLHLYAKYDKIKTYLGKRKYTSNVRGTIYRDPKG